MATRTVNKIQIIKKGSYSNIGRAVVAARAEIVSSSASKTVSAVGTVDAETAFIKFSEATTLHTATNTADVTYIAFTGTASSTNNMHIVESDKAADFPHDMAAAVLAINDAAVAPAASSPLTLRYAKSVTDIEIVNNVFGVIYYSIDTDLIS